MKELADISSISVFVAVAETGSFTEGAKRVALTRSAAGKAIARLEELLSTRLLNRTTRSVSLTADGDAFYQRCTQILLDLEDAQNSVLRGTTKPRGTLRITATEAYGRKVILPVLDRYLARWPELTVEASFTDRVTDIIEEGFDIAIRFGAMTTNTELISKVIARNVGRLYASPAYLARYGNPVTPGELGDHSRLLFGTREKPYTWELKTIGGIAVTVEGPIRLLSDNTNALLDAARSGMGIALLPEFLSKADLETGALELVLPDYSTQETPISVIYPSRRHLSPKIRLFIDLLAGGVS